MVPYRSYEGRRKRRRVARTVLLVGEGDSEEYFLRHLKTLYVQRGCGVVVTIKNARGKGAAHVVDVAIRMSRNADYDIHAALLDTDTDWNEKSQSAARKGKVHVLPSEPCLEALLLAIHGLPVQGRPTARLKHDFAARFGSTASQAEVFPHHFPADLLENARTRLPVLRQRLALLKIGGI